MNSNKMQLSVRNWWMKKLHCCSHVTSSTCEQAGKGSSRRLRKARNINGDPLYFEKLWLLGQKLGTMKFFSAKPLVSQCRKNSRETLRHNIYCLRRWLVQTLLTCIRGFRKKIWIKGPTLRRIEKRCIHFFLCCLYLLGVVCGRS